MNDRPVFTRSHVGAAIVAATLSVIVATLLFIGTAELFVRDGFPLQNVVMAEAVCSEHPFVSDREACVRSILAASYHRQVATR